MKTTVAKKKVSNTIKVIVPFRRDVLARVRKDAKKVGMTVSKFVALAAADERPF